MVIGIDASRANRKQKTGIGWYSRHLIQELKKIPLRRGDKFILYSNDELRDDLAELPENWQSKVLKWPLRYLWTQIRLAWEMMSDPPDVLFVPAHCLPVICPVKSVMTMHDLGFKYFKEAYSFWQRIYLGFAYWWAAYHADGIIVPSKSTKADVEKFYNIRQDKIRVIYEGYDVEVFHFEENQEKINAVLKKYRIEKPYFLYVGRIEDKKNILGLIESYKKLAGKRLNLPKMVLIGGKGFGHVRIEKETKSLGQMIFFLGYVGERDLGYFYNGATAFVFPSLYEGFGLPVLEAMACGCPVIVSESGCLPEIGDSAALYFRSGDTDDLAEKMEKLIEDDDLADQLRRRGLENIRNFSWRKCAFETYEVFRSIG